MKGAGFSLKALILFFLVLLSLQPVMAKSKYFLEPYIGYEAISWSSELKETQSDRYVTLEASGSMMGPKAGLKILRFLGKRFKIGIDLNYSMLKSEYIESTESSYDDSFEKENDLSKSAGNFFFGYQGKKLGLSLSVSPITYLNFKEGFLNYTGELDFEGASIGAHLNYLIGKRLNLNIDTSFSTFSKLTISEEEYELPSEIGNNTQSEITTQEVSISLSYIF